jgi:hypothetical protein
MGRVDAWAVSGSTAETSDGELIAASASAASSCCEPPTAPSTGRSRAPGRRRPASSWPTCRVTPRGCCGVSTAPRGRAALFRAATKIPGVDVVEGRADLDGRKGVAVGRYEPENGTRQEVIFDPDSSEVIGEREGARRRSANWPAGSRAPGQGPARSTWRGAVPRHDRGAGVKVARRNRAELRGRAPACGRPGRCVATPPARQGGAPARRRRGAHPWRPAPTAAATSRRWPPAGCCRRRCP